MGLRAISASVQDCRLVMIGADSVEIVSFPNPDISEKELNP